MLDDFIPMLRLLHDERARSDEDACAKGQAGEIQDRLDVRTLDRRDPGLIEAVTRSDVAR